MPLTFHPGAGRLLMCDFSQGFRPPEMTKKRPAVTISPRRRNTETVTVVPVSTSQPDQVQPWHHQLSAGAYPLPHVSWAKCDMVTTVALWRLDRLRSGRGPERVWNDFAVLPGDMEAIRAGIVAAFGWIS